MPTDPSQQFLTFMQQRTAQLRSGDMLPASLEEWEQRKKGLRQQLLKSWGGFPTAPCDLSPRILGELKRDGYRVEKVVFQTRPDVWMTANAYVPEGSGKRAAVLCVHGHWKGAKQDPVVQSRCIGLAKLGFFVLVVDAFGAGERALSKKLGEYHGEMVGSTLLPVGLPLPGLQVYENMRAVDYMLTRPEVDGSRLGITGASGGGNQSMYAGAYDERFKAVVPVCSVGTYQSYIGAACCVCELVPSVLAHTEQSGVLSLVAPRALMIINATRDVFQFSIGEAQKTIAAVQHVYRMYGKAGNISHDLFESGHDYGKAMREAAYGWMTLHLKGEGQGNPISEPALQTEDPEALRCYPGDSRPDDFVTLPQFAAREGRRLVARYESEKIDHKEEWKATADLARHTLANSVLGGWPGRTELQPVMKSTQENVTTYVIETEPGIEITAAHHSGKPAGRKLAIVLDLAGSTSAENSTTAKRLSQDGWDRVFVDLRATGKYAIKGDQIFAAPDHNSSEWAIMAGRPLLGQWIWDVRKLIDVLSESLPQLMSQVTLVGIGPAAVVALGASIYTPKVTNTVVVDGLVSHLSDQPYVGQRMGIMAPGIVRDVGDIPQLMALVAPRKLACIGGVKGNGAALTTEQVEQALSYPRNIYKLLQAGDQLVIRDAAATID